MLPLLADLLFGRYRKRVLSQLLLNPETDYHVRELARLTDTAAGTLHKELKRLATAGLLLRREQGNQVRYQANVACPVFPELAGLLRKTTGAAQVVAEALRLQSLPIQLAFIFGSVARGTETAVSDIDLMLVGDVGFADIVRALQPAQTALGRDINPVIYSRVEFKRRLDAQDSFLGEVLAGPLLFLIGSADDLGQFTGDPSPARV